MKQFFSKILLSMSLCIFLSTSYALSDYKNLSTRPKPPNLPETNVDLHLLEWADAFLRMCEKMQKEYPFTTQKNIQWESLCNHYSLQIKNAEDHKDAEAYFVALSNFLVSFPDGHVMLSAKSTAISDIPGYLIRHWTEGYGMALTVIDDGSVVVSILQPHSPADLAGIKLGAKILTWNGQPIQSTIGNIPLTWNRLDNNPATNSGQVLEQYRFLTLALQNTAATITFTNPDTNQIQQTTLTADVIGMDIFSATSLSMHNNPSASVEYKMLPSGYGYIKINNENPDNEDLTKSTAYLTFKKAIELFTAQHTPGIIVDLRGNSGGNDYLATLLSGFFYQTISFYEYLSLYDTVTKQFEIWQPYTAYIEPQQPYYGGEPLIVLTDLGTVSSGEGIAMALKRLPQAHLMSYYKNTQGSFGYLLGQMVFMPNPSKPDNYFIVIYPVGKSLDLFQQIQIDSDAKMHGGVSTDLLVPMSAKNAIDIYTNHLDPLLLSAENCLRTQCWPKSNSWPENSSNPGSGSSIVAVAAIGAASIAATMSNAYSNL